LRFFGSRKSIDLFPGEYASVKFLGVFLGLFPPLPPRRWHFAFFPRGGPCSRASLLESQIHYFRDQRFLPHGYLQAPIPAPTVESPLFAYSIGHLPFLFELASFHGISSCVSSFLSSPLPLPYASRRTKCWDLFFSQFLSTSSTPFLLTSALIIFPPPPPLCC